MIVTSELLRFPSDVELRRQIQPVAARRHPGKLHLHFLAHIANAERLHGLHLLDPMAGPGSLLYLTLAPWDCHILLNELERPWVQAARATWAHLQATRFDVRGTARIRWGDARTLPLRLGRRPPAIDGLCCSPPYGRALSTPSVGPALRRARAEQRPHSNYGLLVQPSYEVEGLITSPPYANALSWNRHSGGSQHREAQYGSPSGIASRMALRQGYDTPVDGLVTSPPYAMALSHQRHGEDYGENKMAKRGAMTTNLRRGYDAPPDGSAPPKGVRNPAQIGNLRGKRYTGAMAEVYAACVPLVRPGGPIIIVLKNVVEKNQEVDLVGQARQQLEALGCTYIRTHWRYVAPAAFHNVRKKARSGALVITQEAALVLRAPI